MLILVGMLPCPVINSSKNNTVSHAIILVGTAGRANTSPGHGHLWQSPQQLV